MYYECFVLTVGGLQVNGMRTRFRENPLAPKAKLWLIAMMLTFCAIPLNVSATLGGDVASVQDDQQDMNAAQQITANTAAAYTVYELKTATGMVVREYVSAAGTVFAIAWQGPMLPDLRQLMGGYFAQYTEAAQGQHGGHGHLVIHHDELAVESSGHMRAFFGRAYLPQRLPQGVAVSDIQ